MSIASSPWKRGFSSLPESLYHRVDPTPVPDPYPIAFNSRLANEMGLSSLENDQSDWVKFLGGNAVIPGTTPVAAVYAGHQFGVWVPQLGDGRAILLGELTGPDHERREVQLKGAGLTNYSRFADGRAVLRSTIREYLASEAMHGLGVPTTRALAIVGSDLPVFRERTESAAVLTRVAPTFVRFGSFEFFASRQDDVHLRLLADHVIERHFPACLTLPAAERYTTWFREVVHATARLMADWIAVGFTHGVMNTDNMSILGLTLDYGPYGWMDAYQPDYIPNHTDHAGRYSYGHQPGVGLWNCARLGEALLALIPEADAFEILEGYRTAFANAIDARMHAKIGLATEQEGDVELIHDFLMLMHSGELDYTRSFRALSRWRPGVVLEELGVMESAEDVHAEARRRGEVEGWLVRYEERLKAEGSDDTERSARMLRVNPKYVLRNWMAQEAIEMAEHRSYDRIEELRALLASPFDEHPKMEHYAAKPPEWARHLVLSCSS